MTWFLWIFTVSAFSMAAGNYDQIRKLELRLAELERKRQNAQQ